MIIAENLTVGEREALTNGILLMNAAAEALVDKPFGTRMNISCPSCGDLALIWKSLNGHKGAVCRKCGAAAQE